MTIEKAFNLMLKDKRVRITKEERDSFNIEELGQWFYIITINSDRTVNLCSMYHHRLERVSVDSII